MCLIHPVVYTHLVKERLVPKLFQMKNIESLRRCIVERDMYNENPEIKFIPDITDDNCKCLV